MVKTIIRIISGLFVINKQFMAFDSRILFAGNFITSYIMTSSAMTSFIIKYKIVRFSVFYQMGSN